MLYVSDSSLHPSCTQVQEPKKAENSFPMDYTFSPHRDAGGTLHLPSPTHAHVDGFAASVDNIRRSLSRSPSKAPRFQVGGKSPTGSPNSPLSPLALSRAFTPRAENNTTSYTLSNSASPVAEQTYTPAKKKLSLRRATQFRSSPRISSTRSPMRRVLSDTSNQGNVTPSLSRRSSSEADEENKASDPDSPVFGGHSELKPPAFQFSMTEGPIKFDGFVKSKHESLAISSDAEYLAKSSPLKRSDGRMDLGQPNSSGPSKRRSVHGPPFSADMDVFHQSTPLDANPYYNMATEDRDRERDQACEQDRDREAAFTTFSSPASKRAISLRKSVHRQTPVFSRSRVFLDPSQEAVTGSPVFKARNRMSLDCSFFGAQTGQQQASPFVRSTTNDTTNPDINTNSNPNTSTNSSLFQRQPQIPSRSTSSSHQPHPLSNALTASSSASSLTDDSQMTAPPYEHRTKADGASRAPVKLLAKNPAFARSLPIGSTRPYESSSSQSSDTSSFATPVAMKDVKPHPAAFMSTGLISKRNRHLDFHPSNSPAGYAVPDTPSKRASFPPITTTPLHKGITGRKRTQTNELSSPFISHSTRASLDLFSKSIKITNDDDFGGELIRRNSTTSIDGEDNGHSPCNQDSQSSADELPPTPTKATGSAKSKQNSLRSSLFGRRASLGPDTFLSPNATPDNAPPRLTRKVTPTNGHSSNSGRTSPHTPHTRQGAFTPPDASRLSISANNLPGTGSLNSSTNSNIAPATPTGQRDQGFFGDVKIVRVLENDVDMGITSRFSSITTCGTGEFSKVYKVQKALPASFTTTFQPINPNGAWVVKKSKRPYLGVRDRERKMREARVLEALRGNEHIVEFLSCWESDNHLYIHTEYCEGGNLTRFLAQAGQKARLDDFRIWKIMLELSMGIKYIHDCGYIHLDLKPANVFITFEGVLKIGDFGMASTWPAPTHLEGEGDREYIGPEILAGRFDKPADIFSLGMIMLEIAGNIYLPDNGTTWQRLRSGDLSDIPSLTWSSDSALARDENGDPVDADEILNASPSTFAAVPRTKHKARLGELDIPPNFMVDAQDDNALDKVVQWMIDPDPDYRPTIEEVCSSVGVQWVECRRRAGATIYEGIWGPADYVLQSAQDVDVEMADV